MQGWGAVPSCPDPKTATHRLEAWAGVLGGRVPRWGHKRRRAATTTPEPRKEGLECGGRAARRVHVAPLRYLRGLKWDALFQNHGFLLSLASSFSELSIIPGAGSVTVRPVRL